MKKLSKKWYLVALSIYVLIVAMLLWFIIETKWMKAICLSVEGLDILFISGLIIWAFYDKEYKKILFKIALFFRKLRIWLNFKFLEYGDCGDSMNFLGRNYKRGDMSVKLNIGDEVIIHYLPGISQATKNYPAKIIAEQVKGKDGKAEGIIWVLATKGIRGNIHKAWINDYLFQRLEFVSRNCKEE